MFLPIPPSTIADLGHSSHYPKRKTSRQAPSDMDLLLVPDSLQPDPVFMGLRHIMTTGPIGHLRSRYDAWREEREDRRHEADRAIDAASRIVQQRQASTLTPAVRDRIDHDLAA